MRTFSFFALAFFLAGRAAAEVKTPASLGSARSAMDEYHHALNAGSLEWLHMQALNGQQAMTDGKSVPVAAARAAQNAPALLPSAAPQAAGLAASLPMERSYGVSERGVYAATSGGTWHKERTGYGALALGAGTGVGALVGLAFANPLLGALVGLAVGAFFAYAIMTVAD